MLDLERATGHLKGPLHGVPVLVKDNLDVAGLPTTAGSVALQNSIPAKDSTVVARLRAAGAVILGKTNLTEFANFMTTGTMPSGYSSLGGQVLNPYDIDATPSAARPPAAARRRPPASRRSRSAPRRVRLDRDARPRRRGTSACVPPSASSRGPASSRSAPRRTPPDRSPRRSPTRPPSCRRSPARTRRTRRPTARPRPSRTTWPRSATTALNGKRIGVINNTNAQLPGGDRGDPGARGDDGRDPDAEPGAELPGHPGQRVQARPQRLPRPAARERADEVAGGHHRLQRRPRGRGAEVRPGAADRQRRRSTWRTRRPTRPTSPTATAVAPPPARRSTTRSRRTTSTRS